MREQLLDRKQRLGFILDEPEFGPGRIDTFSPAKALLNFRMDQAPAREAIGTSDLPSIWNQRKRKGMWLHWDGNNKEVEERNRSAAFGTGATPTTLDRRLIHREISTLPKEALSAKPFRRAVTTKALFAQLGVKTKQWCCTDLPLPAPQRVAAR